MIKLTRDQLFDPLKQNTPYTKQKLKAFKKTNKPEFQTELQTFCHEDT